MRQKLKGKGDRDFLDHSFTQRDLFQESSFFARGARGAGQRVIDEEMQRVRAVRVVGIFDLRNDFFGQVACVDGLGAQALCLAGFDLIQIFLIKAHGYIRFVLVPVERTEIWVSDLLLHAVVYISCATCKMPKSRKCPHRPRNGSICGQLRHELPSVEISRQRSSVAGGEKRLRPSRFVKTARVGLACLGAGFFGAFVCGCRAGHRPSLRLRGMALIF